MARSSRSSSDASRPSSGGSSRRDRRAGDTRTRSSRSSSGARSSRSSRSSGRSTRGAAASRAPLPGSRAARAARRRRRRIRTLTATSAAIVLLLAGITGAWALLRDEGGKAPAQVAAPATTTEPDTPASTLPPTTTPPPPPQFVVATQTVPEITVYESPSDTAPVKTTFSNKTEYSIDRTFLVTTQEPAGWLQVMLPLKPNGQQGWIHDTDVTRALIPYEIRVDRAAHKLTVLNLGQVVLETPVAVGAPGTPTPSGIFYVTDPVPGGGGSYGPWALGLSGYSEALESFGGGPPQIALHGTNHPELIGQDVSNGCVRVPNDMITQVHDMVPLGTPVTIV
jgi:lipoprotein-anchoring transpeptidase ErfK/SrfK